MEKLCGLILSAEPCRVISRWKGRVKHQSPWGTWTTAVLSFSLQRLVWLTLQPTWCPWYRHPVQSAQTDVSSSMLTSCNSLFFPLVSASHGLFLPGSPLCDRLGSWQPPIRALTTTANRLSPLMATDHWLSCESSSSSSQGSRLPLRFCNQEARCCSLWMIHHHHHHHQSRSQEKWQDPKIALLSL